MGKEAHFITLGLVAAGALLFIFYGRTRGKREYALLHLIEKVTAKELTTYSLEAELREIIRERDRIKKDRFDDVVESCPVLDLDHGLDVDRLFALAADTMAQRLRVDRHDLRERLSRRERESSRAITGTLAIAQIARESDFEERWMGAKDAEAIRDIVLLGKRKHA